MFAQEFATRVNSRLDTTDAANAQGAIAQEADSDRDVHRFLDKIDELIGHHQFESNVGMLTKKALAEPWQDFGSYIVGCRDANKARDAFVFVAGFADGAGEVVEGLSAAVEKASSGVGQLKFSGRSIDKWNADLGLEGGDGSADT